MSKAVAHSRDLTKRMAEAVRNQGCCYDFFLLFLDTLSYPSILSDDHPLSYRLLF